MSSHRHVWLMALLLGLAPLLTQCSGGSARWHYNYIPGRTSVLVQGQAVPPANLPPHVYHATLAGNRLNGKPYKWGGGHKYVEDSGYDCSGTVSYVLYRSGLCNCSMTSNELRHYGESGPGKHITIYAKKGHAFIEVAGLRLDTEGEGGPRWTTNSRSLDGFRARHPPGL